MGGEIVARFSFSAASSRPESRRIGARIGPRVETVGLARLKLWHESALFVFDRFQTIPLNFESARYPDMGLAPRWWQPRNLLSNWA